MFCRSKSQSMIQNHSTASSRSAKIRRRRTNSPRPKRKQPRRNESRQRNVPRSKQTRTRRHRRKHSGGTRLLLRIRAHRRPRSSSRQMWRRRRLLMMARHSLPHLLLLRNWIRRPAQRRKPVGRTSPRLQRTRPSTRQHHRLKAAKCSKRRARASPKKTKMQSSKNQQWIPGPLPLQLQIRIIRKGLRRILPTQKHHQVIREMDTMLERTKEQSQVKSQEAK